MADAPIRFHWLRLRATCHGTEDPDKVAAALVAAAGVPDASHRIQVTSVASHYGGDVTLLEMELKRAAEIRGALVPLRDHPSIIDEIDARTDDDGVFYFRIHKQDALRGDVRLTRGDDAIHARLKVEVHPAGRLRAIAALRSHFSS